MKKCLNHHQHNQNKTKYREYILAVYQRLRAHTWKFLFRLGILYEVISRMTPPNGVSLTGIDILELDICLGKTKHDELEREADDLTKVYIYAL